MFAGCHPKQRVKLNRRRARIKKARHLARLLVYKRPKACAYEHWMPKRKLTIVKGNMERKWHPAAKAREAEKLIKGINPGLGWKIQIVMDTSVDPPEAPEPPPPEIIDDTSPKVQFVMNQDWSGWRNGNGTKSQHHTTKS